MEPRDLLIECGGCGIENLYSDYTPKKVPVCNQCRERLIWPNFNDTHVEYRCSDCGFCIALKKETPFEEGKTPCRCESLKLSRVHPSRIAEEAESAGAFDPENDPDDDGGHDWIRSDPQVEIAEYNELFDQDPGQN